MSFSYIKSKNDIVIVPLDRPWETYTVDSTHVNFHNIIDALKDNTTTTDEMVSLISPAASIAKAVSDYNGIQVLNGTLYYNGDPVGNSLAMRILDIYSEGLPVEPWALFAEKLYRNPDTYVRNELDLWLESSDLPITPDGDFLAYKKVRSNYTDIYTGKFDNSIGRTPSIDRKTVDKDRHRTCSVGLHFCSKSYLGSFGSHSGSDRVMIVKVSPEDVVSIPSDYSNAKGRAWRYTVVGEILPQEVEAKTWKSVEYGEDYPALVADVKLPEQKSRTYYIETKELGRLNIEHLRNGIAKHGSAAAWAKKLGVGASTVKGWRKKFRALGADI